MNHSAALALVLLAPGAATADVVFSQPTHPNAAKVGLGYYSQTTPRPTRSYLHADNVKLDAAAQVGRVAWWGMSEGVDHADLSNFTSFTVTLHSARLSVGRWIPNQPLSSETFAIADTAPTATGRAAASTGALEFRHEVTLAQTFNLSAGTMYFISIGAGFISGTSDAWLWQDSNTTEKNSAIYTYATGAWSAFIDTDSALVLSSIPAPGVTAFGLAALLTNLRRARRATAANPAR